MRSAQVLAKPLLSILLIAGACGLFLEGLKQLHQRANSPVDAVRTALRLDLIPLSFNTDKSIVFVLSAKCPISPATIGTYRNILTLRERVVLKL
jgi:hypothetical protein